MKRARMVVVSALSATALLVAGCGNGEDGEDQSEQNSQQEEQDASEQEEESDGEEEADEASEEAEGDSEGGGPGEATEPGTTLSFGEQAVLPVTKEGEEHLVGMTVTEVDAGDQQAFSDEFGDQAEGISPFYITYEVENLDGTDLSYVSAPRVRGTLADGESTMTTVSGQLDDCESESASEDFTEAGATFSGCELDGATDDEIVEVAYEQDDYRENPVVWTD